MDRGIKMEQPTFKGTPIGEDDVLIIRCPNFYMGRQVGIKTFFVKVTKVTKKNVYGKKYAIYNHTRFHGQHGLQLVTENHKVRDDQIVRFYETYNLANDIKHWEEELYNLRVSSQLTNNMPRLKYINSNGTALNAN